ncbi:MULTISPECIES: hypothetical protein [unclassified Curtobacterium]|uniref:hypothetical protein n=1 Tax=unclassified Curtobacterium TaxID=257496 RepID=UPI0037F5F63B
MAEIAPDDENSLGPDLDPPADPFPPGPRGDLLRQIDQVNNAAINSRAIAAQYTAAAEQNEARLVELQAELDALPPES